MISKNTPKSRIASYLERIESFAVSTLSKQSVKRRQTIVMLDQIESLILVKLNSNQRSKKSIR